MGGGRPRGRAARAGNQPGGAWIHALDGAVRAHRDAVARHVDELGATRAMEDLRAVVVEEVAARVARSLELDWDPRPTDRRRRRAPLAAALCRDAALATALDRLATAASIPPAERHGRAHERLLGHALARDADAWRLAPHPQRRKRAGAFYTPASLTGPTAARVLDPLVRDRDGQAVPERASALRVCDPALGSGSFLLAALRHLRAVVDEASPDGTERTRRRRARAIARDVLHGVDRDPEAVRAARWALWLELADPAVGVDEIGRQLRVGDGLIGSWPEHVGAYPLAAWWRDGRDAERVEVRAELERRVLPALRRAIEAGEQGESGRRGSRGEADAWCALWFWPADRLAEAPVAGELRSPPTGASRIVARLARRHRFFHWALEFPDVFGGEAPGFDAVLGNPPWEIRKPSSREFFAAVDPAHRTLGRADADRWQRAALARSPELAARWRRHRDDHRARARWVRHAAHPFGDPRGGGVAIRLARSRRDDERLHARWRAARTPGPPRPFRLQGRGDANSYKLFVELSDTLLRAGGRLGLWVPSGLYTDLGSRALRSMLLERYRWEWLFAFDNRDVLFDIHRSFRFAVVVAAKGGTTEAVRAAFLRGDAGDWGDADDHAMTYSRALVRRFSPRTGALLELGGTRDRDLLSRLVERHPRVGDPDGWPARCTTEFHMTRDAARFLPRDDAEADGWVADGYGHWLRGPWQPVGDARGGENGWVRSADGRRRLALGAIDDVALPLVQGAAIQGLSGNAAAYAGGAGHRTRWEPQSRPDRPPRPQFLVRAGEFASFPGRAPALRTAFRALTNPTNERTVVATVIEDLPCGNSLGLLEAGDGGFADQAFATAVMASTAYDWTMRQRLAGTNLNAHFLWESCWPRIDPALLPALAVVVARLTHPGPAHARRWCALAAAWPGLRDRDPRDLWAIDAEERLRLRCLLDGVVAALFGLDEAALGWILRDCDLPAAALRARDAGRALDPRGLWRVDRERPPELRATVLTRVAHRAVVERGVAEVIGEPPGEGWPLPATLRLEALGLGRDDRARAPQPVRGQLAGGASGTPHRDPADGWRRVERHARTLAAIRGRGEAAC